MPKPPAIQVEVDDTEVRLLLQNMSAKAKDLRKLMAMASVDMEKNVLGHFDEEAGSKGKWPPLKFRQGQPLRDTGRLFNSIKPYFDSAKAVVGTNVVYAPIHNFGGFAGRGRKVPIPQREYMYLSDNVITKIKDMIRNYVVPN